MKPKNFWAWVFALGILLMIIGGVIAFIPYVGLPIMGLGGLMMIVAVIALIPILIRERSKDNKEMRENIKEEDLRP
jgi:uncharacterized membrane protein HdeD (DUF308 family)